MSTRPTKRSHEDVADGDGEGTVPHKDAYTRSIVPRESHVFLLDCLYARSKKFRHRPSEISTEDALDALYCGELDDFMYAHRLLDMPQHEASIYASFMQSIVGNMDENASVDVAKFIVDETLRRPRPFCSAADVLSVFLIKDLRKGAFERVALYRIAERLVVLGGSILQDTMHEALRHGCHDLVRIMLRDAQTLSRSGNSRADPERVSALRILDALVSAPLDTAKWFVREMAPRIRLVGHTWTFFQESSQMHSHAQGSTRDHRPCLLCHASVALKDKLLSALIWRDDEELFKLCVFGPWEVTNSLTHPWAELGMADTVSQRIEFLLSEVTSGVSLVFSNGAMRSISMMDTAFSFFGGTRETRSVKRQTVLCDGLLTAVQCGHTELAAFLRNCGAMITAPHIAMTTLSVPALRLAHEYELIRQAESEQVHIRFDRSVRPDGERDFVKLRLHSFVLEPRICRIKPTFHPLRYRETRMFPFDEDAMREAYAMNSRRYTPLVQTDLQSVRLWGQPYVKWLVKNRHPLPKLRARDVRLFRNMIQSPLRAFVFLMAAGAEMEDGFVEALRAGVSHVPCSYEEYNARSWLIRNHNMRFTPRQHHWIYVVDRVVARVVALLGIGGGHALACFLW